jgi:3-oxoacyl-[acyl-carrier protein] reductase
VTTQATIVVSGGGTGIGAAVARRLAADGRHVTIVGRRSGPLEVIRAETGGDIAVADVSTEDGATAVAAQLAERGLGCEGVVAAAGGIGGSPDSDSTLTRTRDEWQASFRSNVLSAVLLAEVLRASLEERGGRVVLLSSVAALRGSGGGPYGAMKAALHAWAFDLARELGEHGGTANVVAPGFVPDTEFWSGRLTDESRANRAAQSLVNRAGTPDEVASLIVWLLGPDGGWMTGQVLSPNGGVVLGR